MEMDSTDSFINVWMYVIDKPKKHSKSYANAKNLLLSRNAKF